MARRINKHNAMTVISATILIGTELVAVAAAGGWAVANLFQFGSYGMYALQALFMILAFYGIHAFFKSATRAEPIFESG
ncbi:hypothetical protein GCM10007276_32820 [Agaricicola taiwanensis]|uniref:Uncharacterized protein n=1 Tax=Agaricicola taiwanensis TaxID=591372 RepID=A0A8J3DYD4_9RHOB|nr:hypothetical protein [Agaricicola taiwanensis]GGE53211.1 hypothetical protein GCM10007276_32820 [Agaricicola taiwanensis]